MLMRGLDTSVFFRCTDHVVSCLLFTDNFVTLTSFRSPASIRSYPKSGSKLNKCFAFLYAILDRLTPVVPGSISRQYSPRVAQTGPSNPCKYRVACADCLRRIAELFLAVVPISLEVSPPLRRQLCSASGSWASLCPFGAGTPAASVKEMFHVYLDCCHLFGPPLS